MSKQAESTIGTEPSADSVDADSGVRDRCEQDEPFVDEYDPEFDKDYVPDGIEFSSAELEAAHEGLGHYVAKLIERVGEPTPEEVARSEAWWRPIEEHLAKDNNRAVPSS